MNTGYYYFTLLGDGNTIKDTATGEEYKGTGLVTTYNGSEVTVLEGAKVNISAKGISVLYGNVYVKDLHVQANDDSGDESSSNEGENEPKEPGENDPYFKGVASGVDSKGNLLSKNSNGDDLAGWNVTGVFFNYSDSTGMENIFVQNIKERNHVLRLP